MNFSKPIPLKGMKMTLGEGPCWAKRHDQIWFVDIYGKALNAYSPKTQEHAVYPLPLMPGAVAPMTDGRALLALEDGFYAFDLATRALDKIVELKREGIRFNDGKCSPDGYFFAGSMEHAEKNKRGIFYRMNKFGEVAQLLTGVGVSNGLGWHGNKMYYIDTMEQRVDAFDYSPETGEICNRRSAIDFAGTAHRNPDGMCVDTNGALFVAEWGNSRVSVWSSAGENIAEIALPCKYVSCCAFGPEGVLYISSARGDDASEYAGCAFAVQTDTYAAPAYEFTLAPQID